MPGSDRRRDILERVASGEVTPEEAAELLSQLETAGASAPGGAMGDAGDGQPPGASRSLITKLRVRRGPAEDLAGAADDAADALADVGAEQGRPRRTPPAPPVPPTPPTPPAPPVPPRATEPTTPLPHWPGTGDDDSAGRPDPGGSGADADADAGHDHVVLIRVRSNCRAVSIVGDPEVRTAVAEGDHTAHLDKDTLTIEATLDRNPGFAFLRTPGLRTRTMVRLGAHNVRPLTIRMNPELALDAQVDAGSMTIRRIQGPIRAHTSAGALRVDDFEGPIELRVAAGSATAHGRIATGSSRIECDAGKVTLRLTPDSSVRIRGRVSLGQLTAPDAIGDGEADLQIAANLGSVDVAVDTDDPDGADDPADTGPGFNPDSDFGPGSGHDPDPGPGPGPDFDAGTPS